MRRNKQFCRHEVENHGTWQFEGCQFALRLEDELFAIATPHCSISSFSLIDSCQHCSSPLVLGKLLYLCCGPVTVVSLLQQWQNKRLRLCAERVKNVLLLACCAWSLSAVLHALMKFTRSVHVYVMMVGGRYLSSFGSFSDLNALQPFA